MIALIVSSILACATINHRSISMYSMYTVDGKLAEPDSISFFIPSLGQCSNMLNPVIMEKTIETEKTEKVRFQQFGIMSSPF